MTETHDMSFANARLTTSFSISCLCTSDSTADVKKRKDVGGRLNLMYKGKMKSMIEVVLEVISLPSRCTNSKKML